MRRTFVIYKDVTSSLPNHQGGGGLGANYGETEKRRKSEKRPKFRPKYFSRRFFPFSVIVRKTPKHKNA